MELFEVKEIVIIFGIAAVMLLIFSKFRLPSIVAYLFTGMVVGPFGLKLVRTEHVDVLATIGIVLLLFSIGMEFSIRKLLSMKRLFFIGGTVQVFGTLLIGFLTSYMFGQHINEAFFLGCLVSLSSTAIVLKTLAARHEADSPHGKFVLAVAIYQDVITVPMLLLVPFLGGVEELQGQTTFFWLVLKGVGIVTAVYLLAHYVIPKLMFRITMTRKRDLFLLSILAICFSVAWGTSALGLPLTLGAFLAGLTVSESEYRHQAIGDILPLQDLFTSFFFVSVGMLLDFDFVFEHPFMILGICIAVLIMKTAVASLAAVVLKFPLRSALVGGIYLCQVGEFSLVLAQAGRNYELGSDFLYQLFLSVSLFSMAISPYLIHHSGTIASWFSKLPVPDRLKFGVVPTDEVVSKKLYHHVAVIGFGICGKNLARSCKVAKIPYAIIEMNPQTVQEERERGEPIFFGDATHEIVLRQAEIGKAKIAVISINDPIATRRIIESIHRSNPSIYIITRTRFLHDTPYLSLLGSNEVVTDEFESSVEIFTRVLKKYLIPKDEIAHFISDVRLKGYEKMHTLSLEDETRFSDLKFHHEGLGIETIRVQHDSKAVGMSLAETELRKAFGVSVLMIRRGQETLTELDANSQILEDDLVVLFGNQEGLVKSHQIFQLNS